MTNQNYMHPTHSELGKKSEYDLTYNPDKLFPMSRQPNRDTLAITSPLPFYGFDIWNHYEVSWLNTKGKPIAAIAELIIPCESSHIIESKSMKLYFNSFNQTQFENHESVQACIQKDLSKKLEIDSLIVRVIPLSQMKEAPLLPRLPGECIDELDVECNIYETYPEFLKTGSKWVNEILTSDLLKSNCLVTNQPDWCSLQITYEGKQIDREGLLRYIVSFRNTNEFHEHCIEKIFIHLLKYCAPQKLTVYGRSNRRGGIDINSIRSTEPILESDLVNTRLCRQ